jgi:phosphatidylserine decarboxylase
MRIHKEGHRFIIAVLLILVVFNSLIFFFTGIIWLVYACSILSLVVFSLILYFFRNPSREVEEEHNTVFAPADGKVVVIEEVLEDEYFKDKRIQVSIFMSPLNVHVNRYPVSGTVKYFKYHEGDYLVAWHPKSSSHNERTTVVLEAKKGIELLVRQIAGAMARRIVCYAVEGEEVIQGEQMGFIKFGSRVDIFLPLNTKIKVKLNENVQGNRTVIALLE